MSAQGTPDRRRPLLRVSRMAAVLFAVGAAALGIAGLTAGPAAADNCAAFTDCFGQSEAASEAALGLTALAALSLIIDFIGGRGWPAFTTGRSLFDVGTASAWDHALGLIDLDAGDLITDPTRGLFSDLMGTIPDIGIGSLIDGTSGWLDPSGTVDVTARVGGAVGRFFTTDVFGNDGWRSFLGELAEGGREISSLQPGSFEHYRVMFSDPGELMDRYQSFGLGLWDFTSGTAEFAYVGSTLVPGSVGWTLEMRRFAETGEHRGYQLAGQLAVTADQLESLNPASRAFYMELGDVMATGSLAEHEGLSTAGSLVVGFVDWETFKEDPSRWFGRMTGEVALEIGTAGAASGLGLTDNAARAAAQLGDVVDPDLVRAADGIDGAAAGPTGSGTGGSVKGWLDDVFGGWFDDDPPPTISSSAVDPEPSLPPREPSAVTPDSESATVDAPVGADITLPDLATARQAEDWWNEWDQPTQLGTEPSSDPSSWISDINSTGPTVPGRNNNCIDCARAVEARWRGQDATAASHLDPYAGGLPADLVTDWAGGSFRPIPDINDVAAQLDDLGPGSSAVVVSSWKSGGAHAYNAVNLDGRTVWADGQINQVGPWPPDYADDISQSWVVYYDVDGKPLAG